VSFRCSGETYLGRDREADLDRGAAVHGHVAEAAVRVVGLHAGAREEEVGVDVVERDELRSAAPTVDVVYRRGAAVADVAHDRRGVDRRARRGAAEGETARLVLREARRGGGSAVGELQDDDAVRGDVVGGVASDASVSE
jgi:hypothetical protein